MNWLIGIYELTDEQMEKVESIGLKKQTVRNRVEKGESIEKAISYPARKSRKWDKKDIEEAKANGISESAFRKRVLYNDYTVEDAKISPLYSKRTTKNPKKVGE